MCYTLATVTVRCGVVVFGLGQCHRVHGPVRDQFSDLVSDPVSDQPNLVRVVTRD